MTSRTTISIIIIGDEILKGQTKDTNSHFLCRELYECGVEVARISVVPDDVDVIAEEIRSSSEKYSFVFTSGGIGPTHDDVTYEGIAKAFDEKIVLKKDLEKIVSSLCMKMGLDEKAALKMSYVPLSSEIHHIYTSKKNMSFPVVSVRNVFAFSGIPSYLEFAFTKMKSLFCTNSLAYVSRTLYVDRTEFTIMNVLNAAVKKFDGIVKFGSYPDVNNQYYQVKLTIEADNEQAVSDAEAYLRSHLPHNSVVGRFPPNCPDALSLLENVFIIKSETYDKEFSATVEESLKILDQCFDKYPLSNVCLSFNGGKDCTALLHLTHLYLAKFYPNRSEKLKVLYVRSKDPFQEIENFIELCVERYDLNLITYNSSIKDGLKQLQNDHPDIKAVLLGTRNTDPKCSDLKTFHMTDSDWPQFMRVNPLISWTYNLVWKFLRILEVPYCSLYDRGMYSNWPYQKHLKVKDIQKVFDSIGDLIEGTFNPKSLSLLIGKTGEATFSSSACKLLSEAGFSHPLTKMIINAAIKYTSVCGDDCKYFIFILQEMFRFMLNKMNENNEVLIRRVLRDEISALKQLLPCIFNNIYDITNNCLPDSELNSFYRDLSNVVFTFMSSRFSVRVSKILTNLIIVFIQKVVSESSIPLKVVLEYVVSHFDIFCCKIFGHLEESRIMNGFILYINVFKEINLQNVKFIVIYDLEMKLESNQAAWKISDESFPLHLNDSYNYENVFEYFKSQDILLLLTPSVCNDHIKIFSKKHGICIIDRLDKREVEHLLFCLHLNALENLNESLDSKNVGRLNFVKSLSFNKSQFIHLNCVSHIPILNAHHIFLYAPSLVMWKEYYSECLNCFRMIDLWLKSDFENCSLKVSLEVPKNVPNIGLNNSTSGFKVCDLCTILRCDFVIQQNVLESLKKDKFLLPPGAWELIFKNVLQKVPEILKSRCNIVLEAVVFAVERSLYKKVGLSINKDMNSETVHSKIFAKCEMDDFKLVQPIVCNQIMLSLSLDLLMQLLKIECIVLSK